MTRKKSKDDDAKSINISEIYRIEGEELVSTVIKNSIEELKESEEVVERPTKREIVMMIGIGIVVLLIWIRLMINVVQMNSSSETSSAVEPTPAPTATPVEDEPEGW